MGFAAGFSAGSNAVNNYNNRKRQEMLDARDGVLHDERMAEIAQAKSDKQALRDAGAERTTMQGTAVTTGAGDKNLYADPMQAANAAEDAKIEAEMRGQQPSMVNMQAATGITGKMATGHQITTDPVDLKAINGAEAKAGRFQSALDAQGKPMEAMQMQQAVRSGVLAELQIDEAKLTALSKAEKSGALKAHGMLASGNPAEALAILKKANPSMVPEGAVFQQADVPDMFNREKVVKGWQLVVPGEGGNNKVLISDFNSNLMTFLDAGQQLDLQYKRGDANQKQENFVKELALKEKEVNSKAELRSAQAENRMLRLGAAGNGSRSNTATEAGAPTFNPLGSFDSKKAQAVAFEQAAARVDETGKPLPPAAQGKLAQEIYRSMEDSFASENTRRFVTQTASSELRAASSDPVQYAAAYGKAIQLGMKDAQLSALGFKPPPGPPSNAVNGTPGKTPSSTAPAVAPSAPQKSATMTSTINQMQADSMSAFAPLAAKVKQANAAFVAVVKSGDQTSIKRYMDEKEALRTQLESAVNAKFGNAAPKVLQQLYAQ